MSLRDQFLARFSPALLGRKAFVYQRQSTLKQLRENRGSALYQQDLRRIAEEIGFAPASIVVIDCDTGSTAEAVEHRRGFIGLLDAIKSNEAGLVLTSDLSRANRDANDENSLFMWCREFRVALYFDEALHDANDITALLSMKITSAVNEYDNFRRRQHMLSSPLKNASRREKGEARS